jgi:menaquinol-cytochrome c reductase iron-sulfur subunit
MTPNPPAESTSNARSASETRERRNFLSEFVAAVTGGAIVLVPFAAGLGFFAGPILRKRRASASNANARRDEEGYLRVASVSSLPADGRPQSFTVYDDVVDAWNKFVDQPVGRVYLRKRSDGKVTAFNVRCPHLGCAVDYRPSQNDYFCPCHTSAFNLEGEKENEIPPRGMDALEVKVKEGTVWVRFQSFKAGTPDRISVIA